MPLRYFQYEKFTTITVFPVVIHETREEDGIEDILLLHRNGMRIRVVNEEKHFDSFTPLFSLPQRDQISEFNRPSLPLNSCRLPN